MTPAAVQAKLKKLKRQARREWRRRATAIRAALARDPVAHRARAVALTALKLIVIVALPFVLLVRTSVYYYLHVGLAPWTALFAGALFALLLVAGYATWLSRRFTGRARFIAMVKWVALPLVVGWCVYALLFFKSGNAKTDSVRAYFTTVHPILRVGLSTVILFDRRLVVTDFARQREDYTRMGLPVYDRTLHYVQRDGWVHAVDLRTQGQGEIKNRAVQLYFWIMGFETLRHVGTADHLHVELPLR
jgi:hypothetical protein